MPLREDDAVRPDELDCRARLETPLTAHDADPEQARAACRRVPSSRPRPRAAVPATGLPNRSQSLNADWPRSSAANRVPRGLAGEDRAEHVLAVPAAMTVGIPAAKPSARPHLAAHAAPAERRADADLRLERELTLGDQLRARRARCARVHPFDLGQEHEHPRPDEHRDLRRERVVVAEGDLVGRGRVVLVHDRYRAEAEELGERLACVDVRARGRRRRRRRAGSAPPGCPARRAPPPRLAGAAPGRARRQPGAAPSSAGAGRARASAGRARSHRTRRRRRARRPRRACDLSRARADQLSATFAVLADDEARPELDDERRFNASGSRLR